MELSLTFPNEPFFSWSPGSGRPAVFYDPARVEAVSTRKAGLPVLPPALLFFGPFFSPSPRPASRGFRGRSLDSRGLGCAPRLFVRNRPHYFYSCQTWEFQGRALDPLRPCPPFSPFIPLFGFLSGQFLSKHHSLPFLRWFES